VTTAKSKTALNQFRSIQMLRNSERSDFNTCPQKWWWRWNEGLVPVMPFKSAAWFGGIIHVGLAEWYLPPGAKNGFARGRDPRETIAELFKSEYATVSAGPYFDEVAEKEYWDAAALGAIMMTAYLAEYGTDDQWEVLLPEMRFSAGIPFNARQATLDTKHWFSLGFPQGANGNIVKLVGTFDMPIRDQVDGHVKVVDHKTTNKKENVVWLQKDNQTGTYVAVSTGYLRRMGLISEKEAVVGAIWNYLRKGKPDTRPTDDLGRCLNKDGSVSKQQPSPLFWRIDLRRNKANRLRQISRIADDAEHMAAVRGGVLPVTKHPDEHCSWCSFKELCDVDEDGGDTDEFKKAVFKFEDPYADHQPGARNSKESASAKKATGVT
jgi:Zierdtviridae exonuclease